MRILIVEDEKKVAAFIKKGLEEETYAVDIAADGEERCAWHFAKEIETTIRSSMIISNSFKQALLEEIKEAKQKRSAT